VTLAVYGGVFLPDVGLVPGDPIDITLSNLLQQAKDTVAKHVRAGTITTSLSLEWAVPTFFVPKPNGELRMVTDFHESNLLIGKGCITKEQAKNELNLLTSLTAVALLVCLCCRLCRCDGVWVATHIGATALAALNPWQCGVLQCGFSTPLQNM
jgi:hypothetical protein